MPNVPVLQFRDGSEVPAIAYGTGTKWFKRQPQPGQISTELVEAVLTAMREGYRHIDCAEVYGTEEEVGEAIKRFLAERPDVTRSDLFITTKVYPKIGDIHGALTESLSKLGLEYVDLYLIHAPFWDKSKESLEGAWQKMVEEKKRGRVRQIGVSNWRVRDFEALRAGGSDLPAINQIEYNPYLAAPELIAYHATHKIVTAAYGALGPINHFQTTDDSVAQVASRIAESRAADVTSGEVLLAWALQTGALVVTTSADPGRVRAGLRIGELQFPKEDLDKITGAGAGKRLRRFWADQDFS